MVSESDSSDMDSDFSSIEIKEEEKAKAVVNDLLPPCSKERYIKAYNQFMNWRSAKNVHSLSEKLFLEYFNEMSKTLQPSTLWSTYSMLKSTINTKHNVNMKHFTNLTAYLKKQSKNFKSKKSNVFTAQEVERFLNEAPDEIYLATKVVLIFGICGACRSIEFSKITVNDVEKHDQILLVKLRKTETKIDRQFIISEEFENLVEKYQSLRPENLDTDRYFINFQHGKCLRQVIGKNKFANMPRQIATYLNLPNVDLYTGHCFRRTSATLFADSRGSLSTLKRHSGWKSSTDAEGHVGDSVENKTKIIEFINIEHNPSPQPASPGTSTDPEVEVPLVLPQSHQFIEENVQSGSHSIQETQVSQKITKINMPGKTLKLSFSNCSNFTLNFN